jgi:hypothetical protein
MSAFGGKADMTLRGNPLSRSLLGVKQTSLFAAHMSLLLTLQRRHKTKSLALLIAWHLVGKSKLRANATRPSNFQRWARHAATPGGRSRSPVNGLLTNTA